MGTSLIVLVPSSWWLAEAEVVKQFRNKATCDPKKFRSIESCPHDAGEEYGPRAHLEAPDRSQYILVRRRTMYLYPYVALWMEGDHSFNVRRPIRLYGVRRNRKNGNQSPLSDSHSIRSAKSARSRARHSGTVDCALRYLSGRESMWTYTKVIKPHGEHLPTTSRLVRMPFLFPDSALLLIAVSGAGSFQIDIIWCCFAIPFVSPPLMYTADSK